MGICLLVVGNIVAAQGHGVLVGEELLVLSHHLYGMANGTNALLVKMLERYLAHEAVEVYAAVGIGIAVCWKRVVGAAGIVARTLTGILAEEHATRIHNL